MSGGEFDLTLLLLGITRVSIWTWGIYLGFRLKTILRVPGQLAITGFSITTVSSSLFALINSGIVDSEALLKTATFISLPATALLVTGFGLTVQYLVRLRRHQARRATAND